MTSSSCNFTLHEPIFVKAWLVFYVFIAGLSGSAVTYDILNLFDFQKSKRASTACIFVISIVENLPTL